MPLLASKGLPLGVKSRLYFKCSHSIILYGIETWLVKEEDVISLLRKDASLVRWRCHVRPEDKISAEELRARLKLNSMKEYLQDRGLQ